MRDRADPYLRPRGRDGKSADAAKGREVLNRFAVRAEIVKRLATADPPQAGPLIRDIVELGCDGRLDRIGAGYTIAAARVPAWCGRSSKRHEVSISSRR
jgi:hypothetical protein